MKSQPDGPPARIESPIVAIHVPFEPVRTDLLAERFRCVPVVSMGIPVRPNIKAFGMALRINIPRSPYSLQCAWSTSMMTLERATVDALKPYCGSSRDSRLHPGSRSLRA